MPAAGERYNAGMILGAHLSIAGGPWHALERAAEYGFDCVAIFVRNQRQWRTGPLSEEVVRRFRRTRRRLGIGPVVAHGSYLINLAGREEVRSRSIAAMAEELDRAGRLGAEYYVLHPGSPLADGRDVGIERVSSALNEIVAGCGHRRVEVLLETTAGAGRQLAGTFEELAAILSPLRRRGRFGVCLDTCHVFAAGYDIRSRRAYDETMAAFDRIVGLDRLMAVHLNDSLGDLGSRRDRHEHIGAGRIGPDGFAHFVNDPRLASVPMILETPKGLDEQGRDWDRLNGELLRRLAT